MTSHRELSDEAFAAAFADCSLPPALFSHEAHLRLAWIHIRNLGLEAAIDRVCTEIVRYVAHLGAADKYDEALTIAAVRVVHRFWENEKELPFEDFLHVSSTLVNNFHELIKAEQAVS
jgi:hypothetical protein